VAGGPYTNNTKTTDGESRCVHEFHVVLYFALVWTVFFFFFYHHIFLLLLIRHVEHGHDDRVIDRDVTFGDEAIVTPSDLPNNLELYSGTGYSCLYVRR
jgi:hypothetical protein